MQVLHEIQRRFTRLHEALLSSGERTHAGAGINHQDDIAFGSAGEAREGVGKAQGKRRNAQDLQEQKQAAQQFTHAERGAALPQEVFPQIDSGNAHFSATEA